MAISETGPKILALKIDYERHGAKTIHPALLCGDTDRILIDCGYAGFLPKLERALSEHSLSFYEITGLVITHHDHDHCGALAETVEKYPHIRTMSSEFDEPFLDGRKKSLRITKTMEIYDTLTEAEKIEAKAFQAEIESVRPAKIDVTFKGGEILPWCGGVEIIATPGHMPGHISLYARALKTLITGDALVITHGRLRGANPQYAVDIETARKSSRMLLEMDAKTFICYHGGTATIQGKEILF